MRLVKHLHLQIHFAVMRMPVGKPGPESFGTEPLSHESLMFKGKDILFRREELYPVGRDPFGG